MTAVTGYLRHPDAVGEQLVFTADDDVWLAPLAGGRAFRLTADAVPVARPRLSADGSLVAWVSRRAGEAEVFVMPSDGGVPRQLTFFGHPSTTLQGFAPDGRLIVLSAGLQPFRSRTWAYAIDLRDSDRLEISRLRYGPVNAVADSGHGPVVVGTGYLRDYAWWKRYRGGTAGRLWLDAAGSHEFAEFLPELVGPKTHPTWVGDRLAFLGDFEGHGNVYSVAVLDGAATELRRHTDHEAFYARQLSGSGGPLVYQHGGQLWTLDSLAADSESRPVPISLTSSLAGRARRVLDAAENIGPLQVDRTGRASAVEVRGSIVWLTHRNGPVRTVAATDGVRHRLPVVLNPPAADSMASVGYVTDAGGEDAIEIATPDGATRRFGTGELGRVLDLVASPDGSTLAIATHDGRLLTLGTADGAITQLDSNPNGEPTGLAFAPDSNWLAYSAAGGFETVRSIRLVELATGEITAVTGNRFFDSNPRFSLDGRYLFFLSVRTFDPVYDAHVFDLGFPLATRPYLVTLAAQTPSPFEPELQGRSDVADSTGGADPAKQNGDSRAGVEEPDGEPDGPTTIPDVRIDVDRIAERVVAFPVAAGRLANLLPVKDGVLWTNAPITGELGEALNPGDDVRPSLQRWDFGKRKQLELAERVDSVAVSGDGKKLVIKDGDALKVVPAHQKPSEEADDSVTIDLSRIRIRIDPVAEWGQMLAETARLMRDHYWKADMAGIDWDSVVAKYQPLVERLATRDDLSDLLWEVNGETGSSHAYEIPAPAKPDPLLRPGYLGADLRTDSDGRWVLERVIAGDNSARGARSPLTAPGVAAQAGDVLLAIDGQPVGVNGPAEQLRGTADKPVEIRLSRDGVERSVVVTPLESDVQLRYLDWVASCRAAVHEATAGRVGYVHIPDMVSNGWAAFHRDLTVEMARDALIVDTRDNNGGHTSQLIIEKLARRVIGWTTGRHVPRSSYAELAPRGPLVSIANEWAGSDGDIVNAAFQSLELGPVFGTRTWGGVIGIDGKYTLVDRTSVTQPRYAFWFDKFGWAVENYGIDPDVVVEFPPQAWRAGDDPQLQAAITYLLGELASRPARPMPDVANSPSRRAPELPPRPLPSRP
jgi:tricorn protease